MVGNIAESDLEKSKRIEAEKLKAAKALAEEQPSKANLAYLDPKDTKVKGFTWDKDVLLFSLERYADKSFLFALVAVVLELIGWCGSIVSRAGNLGAGALIISGIPSMIGTVLIGLSAVSVVIAISGEIYFKVAMGRKFGSPFWSAVFALPVIGGYFLIQWVIAFSCIKLWYN